MHIIYPVEEEEEGNYSRCSRETLLMAYDLAGNSIQLDITLGENSGEISDTCVYLWSVVPVFDCEAIRSTDYHYLKKKIKYF